MTSLRGLRLLRKWVLKKVGLEYKKIIPALIKRIRVRFNELNIVTNRSNAYPLLYFLRDHMDSQYKTLADIIPYDVPGKFYRFVVVYTLLSMRFNRRINVYVHTNEVL